MSTNDLSYLQQMALEKYTSFNPVQNTWDAVTLAVFVIFVGTVLLLIILPMCLRGCCCCCCCCKKSHKRTKAGVDNYNFDL
uniref:small integral membrane protein 22 n=1 Tax=Myxine glutinosa TaxID=7769 RepID=UPI00358E4C4D